MATLKSMPYATEEDSTNRFVISSFLLLEDAALGEAWPRKGRMGVAETDDTSPSSRTRPEQRAAVRASAGEIGGEEEDGAALAAAEVEKLAGGAPPEPEADDDDEEDVDRPAPPTPPPPPLPAPAPSTPPPAAPLDPPPPSAPTSSSSTAEL